MSNLIVVAVIVVAAYVIWKLIQKGSNSVFATTPRIQPSQYMNEYVEPNASHLLLDVRTPQEFASGHIAGATNISLQILPQQMRDIHATGLSSSTVEAGIAAGPRHRCWQAPDTMTYTTWEESLRGSETGYRFRHQYIDLAWTLGDSRYLGQ